MSVASLVRPAKPVSLGDRVAELDLSPMLARIAKRTGASARALRQLDVHYRAYLTLLSRYPHGTLPPSRSVELVWDEHVVADVAGYLRDCQFVAGRLLNRRAADPVDEAGFARTRYLLAIECGIDLADVAEDADPLIAGLAVAGSAG